MTKRNWQEALDLEREKVGDDDTVLLHHFSETGIDGHIFIGPNYAQDTMCEFGVHPTQDIPVVLGELSSALEMIGLPVDGWS